MYVRAKTYRGLDETIGGSMKNWVRIKDEIRDDQARSILRWMYRHDMWWNYSARRLMSVRIDECGKYATRCYNQDVEGAALDVMCDETIRRAAWWAWKRRIMVTTEVRESSL